MRLTRNGIVVAVVVVAAAALAGAFTGDHAIARWAVAHRAPAATTFFRLDSDVSGPGPMFGLGIVLAALAALRSRALAVTILVVTLARPLVSTAIKDAVGRRRPQYSQLVHAAGASFPSGHALASTVGWGSIAAVLLAWSARRVFVVAAFVVAALAVLAVAASRVYLGVHWPSDVVAGVEIGLLLLVPVYRTPAWMRKRLEQPAASPSMER